MKRTLTNSGHQFILAAVTIIGCNHFSPPYDAHKYTELTCTKMPEIGKLEYIGTTYSESGPDYVRKSVFAFRDPKTYSDLVSHIEERICMNVSSPTCGCWRKENGFYKFIASESTVADHFFIDAELSVNYNLLTIREVDW